MRNLKKILALVLALVMSMSLVTVSSAAFTDEAKINSIYAESAEVLAGLGVFKGYEDGSFNPTGKITRAEVAAIIYRVATGDVTDTQVGIYADYNVFSDVKSTAWYAGYVNYCANALYIKGYGDGTFGPNDTVTGYQALAMILRAVGYDKNGEFTGASWQVETAKIGNQLKITRNVSAGTLGTAATREVVAEILFRAIAEAPTVTYSLGLGYSQYTNALTNREFNPTLGELNFDLVQIDGIIDAVGTAATFMYNVVDTFGRVSTEFTNVVNHDVTWENIGYAAYVWAVPNTANLNKAYKAVSGVNVYGESLGVTHDGTKTFAYAVDGTPIVYYNGVRMPADNSTVTITEGTVKHTINRAGALAKAEERGVKVDYIDNDAGKLTEVVVITDYSVTYVSAIASETNTGINALKTGTHYFNDTIGNYGVTTSFATANIVCADQLNVGDMLTYVIYNGKMYADKVEFTTARYNKITFASDLRTHTSWTFGDVTYVKAADFVRHDLYLQQSYVGSYMVIGTDAYGYMLSVEPYVAPVNYLYVLKHNHSDNMAGTTFAKVAFADGSIADVYVKNTAETFGDFSKEMYTYTLTDGVYTLGRKCTTSNEDEMFHLSGSFYNQNNRETKFFNNHHLTNKSVVVDLRNTADVKVYTGYAQIPSIVEGTWHYAVDANGFVTLAFLTAGKNYDDSTYDVIVYTTAGTSYSFGTMYNVPAIIDGEVSSINVSASTYDMLKGFGVGHYIMSYDSMTGHEIVTYWSFAEDWHDVIWQDGTIVLDNGHSYSYTDNVKFYTLDITNGKYYNYLPIVGTDLGNAKAYIRTTKTEGTIGNGLTVDEIYIVFGSLSSTNTQPTAHAYGMYYFAANGKVTNFLSDTPSSTELQNVVNVMNSALEAQATAEAILAGLDNASNTAYVGMVAEVVAKFNAGEYVDQYAFALALLEAAAADLAWVATEIETLAEAGKLTGSDAIVASAMIETAAEAADEIVAVVEKAAESDVVALAALKQDAIEAAKADLVAGIVDAAYDLGKDVYVLGSDVVISADAADAILNNDVVFAGTSIVKTIAAWFASVKAAATETALETVVAGIATELKTVVASFINACTK